MVDVVVGEHPVHDASGALQRAYAADPGMLRSRTFGLMDGTASATPDAGGVTQGIGMTNSKYAEVVANAMRLPEMAAFVLRRMACC